MQSQASDTILWWCEYTFMRVPRTNPIKVIPSKSANFTAVLVGADFDASTGILFLAILITISDEIRPLVRTIWLFVEIPSHMHCPKILSMAL